MNSQKLSKLIENRMLYQNHQNSLINTCGGFMSQEIMLYNQQKTNMMLSYYDKQINELMSKQFEDSSKELSSSIAKELIATDNYIQGITEKSLHNVLKTLKF